MFGNYNVKWGYEVGWAVIVAVVIYAGQALAEVDPTATPTEIGISLLGGVARVVLAVLGSKLLPGAPA